MNYFNKVNKLYLDYTKQYKRKDETFEMMTIKRMFKDLETNEDYTNEQKETIEKYLCERYFKAMSKYKERLEERKN